MILCRTKVLGGEELLFVTEKGVIVRTNADKISQQSGVYRRKITKT